MNVIEGDVDGTGKRFAVVVSRFNEDVSRLLLEGASDCLLRHGVSEDAIDVVWVPGAWELPLVAQSFARVSGPGRKYAAVIALGCVIRGETAHFDYVAGEAARGLADVALDAGVPVALGMLTTEDEEQAFARAGGPMGNKGWDAALSALEMSNLYLRLDSLS